jgi:DNA-binding transcriptional MerR regulator
MTDIVLKNFKIDQAAEACGLSSAMIAYLVRHNVVKPSASLYRRRGKKLLFSFQDLIAIRTIRALFEKGISATRLSSELKKLRRDLKRIDSNELAPELRYLATDGVKVYFWNRAKDPYPSTTTGQFAFAFVIDLQPIHAEMRERGLKAKLRQSRKAKTASR